MSSFFDAWNQSASPAARPGGTARAASESGPSAYSGGQAFSRSYQPQDTATPGTLKPQSNDNYLANGTSSSFCTPARFRPGAAVSSTPQRLPPLAAPPATPGAVVPLQRRGNAGVVHRDKTASLGPPLASPSAQGSGPSSYSSPFRAPPSLPAVSPSSSVLPQTPVFTYRLPATQESKHATPPNRHPSQSPSSRLSLSWKNVGLGSPGLVRYSGSQSQLGAGGAGAGAGAGLALSQMNEPLDPSKTYAKDLNKEQHDAVMAGNGPLLLVASAGSGKTLTLTARIAHMLNNGIPARNILAVTFTRKAAEEMRKRVEKVIGWRKAQGMMVCNFHSLCLRILRDNYAALGFKQQFVVLGADDQKDIVEQALGEYQRKQDALDASRRASNPGAGQDRSVSSFLGNVNVADMADMFEADQLINDTLNAETGGSAPKAGKPRRNNKLVNYFTSFVRKAKAMGKPPGAFVGESREIYESYVRILQAKAAIDFEDMIPLTLQLLRQSPTVLKRYRELYRCVFCDEYQDVTKNQFALLQMLCQTTRNLTVCGDDDQSIYGWRGAVVESFDMFKRAFPKHRAIVLGQTYRSTTKIVRVTGALIARNKHRTNKRIWTDNDTGESVRLMISKNRSVEAEKVLAEIARRRASMGLAYSDIAILARTRRVLQAMEPILRNGGLPVASSASASQRPLMQSREVQDIVAYMELIREHDVSTVNKAFLEVVNVPARGLGKAAVAKLEEYAKSDNVSLLSAAASCRHISGLSEKQRYAASTLASTIKDLTSKAAANGMEAICNAIVDVTDYNEYINKKAKTAREAEMKRGKVKALLDRCKMFDKSVGSGTDPTESLSHMTQFLDALRKTETSVGSAKSNHVTLSTIHQAKGLEWPLVFVVHFNEGVMPLPPREDGEHFGSPVATRPQQKAQAPTQAQNPAQAQPPPQQKSQQKSVSKAPKGGMGIDPIEEERRLAYVALSRAQRLLILCAVTEDGSGQPMIPSRFLHDIPSKFIVGLNDNESSSSSSAPEDTHPKAPKQIGPPDDYAEMSLSADVDMDEFNAQFAHPPPAPPSLGSTPPASLQSVPPERTQSNVLPSTGARPGAGCASITAMANASCAPPSEQHKDVAAGGARLSEANMKGMREEEDHPVGSKRSRPPVLLPSLQAPPRLPSSTQGAASGLSAAASNDVSHSLAPAPVAVSSAPNTGAAGTAASFVTPKPARKKRRSVFSDFSMRPSMLKR